MRLKRKPLPEYNVAGVVFPLVIDGLRNQRTTIEQLEERVAELEAENRRLRKRAEWRSWADR